MVPFKGVIIIEMPLFVIMLAVQLGDMLLFILMILNQCLYMFGISILLIRK